MDIKFNWNELLYWICIPRWSTSDRIYTLALERKNYLFCSNHDAAENTAIMYSLLGCCIAFDVNPREWLTDVLTRIPGYNNDYSQDLAELLPHNWKALQKPEETALKIQ